jgi:hypothetical protein
MVRLNSEECNRSLLRLQRTAHFRHYQAAGTLQFNGVEKKNSAKRRAVA